MERKVELILGCEKARKHICVTNHHDMTLAVKVALNPHTTNQPTELTLYQTTKIENIVGKGENACYQHLTWLLKVVMVWERVNTNPSFTPYGICVNTFYLHLGFEEGVNSGLTLSQTTNFRLFQIERADDKNLI